MEETPDDNLWKIKGAELELGLGLGRLKREKIEGDEYLGRIKFVERIRDWRVLLADGRPYFGRVGETRHPNAYFYI